MDEMDLIRERFGYMFAGRFHGVVLVCEQHDGPVYELMSESGPEQIVPFNQAPEVDAG